jgi:SNF2 family DNA or RNA helicase
MNGILVDEMGLGKTIQTIAFLAHLASSKGVWGPARSNRGWIGTRSQFGSS